MAAQRQRHLPWKRLITAITAILLLGGATLFWILNTEHVIQGDWSNILPICFTVLAVIFAFLAWLFPFSPEQPEATRLPLASKLVRSSFKMGDEAAANFPYLTTPIQAVYNLAQQALLNSSTGASHKRGLLIVGEANAGKTRLAFEVLTQTLREWPVLRWWPDSTMDKVSLHEKHLVIFLDDLQEYVSKGRKEGNASGFTADPRATTLRTLLEKLRQEIPRVVVMATCRLEDKQRVQAELGQLFNELEVLQLPTFNVDVHDPEATKIITDFQRYGSTHIEDWDGTLGSLVLGLSTKNQEYLKIRNEPAAVILRAMKLLTIANILSHTERYLLSVCSEIFGEKILLIDEQKWQEAKTLLVQEQFVTEEADQDNQGLILVIRKDTYFDEVITDYPMFNRPYQFLHDLVRLQTVLVTLKDADGLSNLGDALADLERYGEALQAYERAIELNPNNARAYLNKGVTLGRLERHEEALQAFERTIELDPNEAHAYYNKGVALNRLERYEEALQAFEQAIELDPNEESIQIEKTKLLRKLGHEEEAQLG